MGTQLAAWSAAIEPWAQHTLEIMTSWLAWRVYALIGAALVLALSFWVARAQQVGLLELRPRRGRKPTVRKTIEKKLKELQEFEEHTRWSVLSKAILVAFFGFLIPSLVLALAVYHYSWFLPGRQALMETGCAGGSAVRPTLLETVSYVFSQLSMGTAGIAAEVTPRSFVAALPAFVPADTVAADGLAFYRYFVGGFAAAFLRLLYIAATVSRNASIAERRTELVAALQAATH